MPVFKRSTSAVISVSLPRPQENEPPINLNVNQDLKMYPSSFTMSPIIVVVHSHFLGISSSFHGLYFSIQKLENP